MAYDKNKMFKKALKAIEEHNLFFIADIVAFIAISTETFYRFYPLESKEYEMLRSALDANKIRTKSSIRAKLYKSQKAAELLALYRLICTSEEHQLLNQSYVNHKHVIKKTEKTVIVFKEEPKK